MNKARGGVSVLTLLRLELVKEDLRKTGWAIVIRHYKKLPAAVKADADAGVRRYLAACRRCGVHTEIDTVREIIENASLIKTNGRKF